MLKVRILKKSLAWVDVTRKIHPLGAATHAASARQPAGKQWQPRHSLFTAGDTPGFANICGMIGA